MHIARSNAATNATELLGCLFRFMHGVLLYVHSRNYTVSYDLHINNCRDQGACV